jgi:heme/copper-type cytochrome/quinol oxidase subunit 3
MQKMCFVSIISYEPSVPYSLLSVVSVLVILSYYSMLHIPLALSICLFPLLNSYILTPSINEYLYSSLLLFIFLEVMLFLAYFWYYFHNISYSGPFSLSLVSVSMVSSSIYYVLAGLLLSILSIYLSLTPIVIFIILSFTEFNNVLDILYINDNPFVSLQLTIVSLHLLHLLVGILFILSELSYPHYYHFIEVIWLLIGYCIYLA